MNLKKGNLVKVLTGKDKNKSGEIIEIINTLNKAKVKGINIVKKHLKATKEKKGGIISKENFIHLSNLMIVENKIVQLKIYTFIHLCIIIIPLLIFLIGINLTILLNGEFAQMLSIFASLVFTVLLLSQKQNKTIKI